MNRLPINRILDEETRVSTIKLHHKNDEVYDLHYQADEEVYYVTEHAEPEKILMVASKELWEMIFEKG